MTRKADVYDSCPSFSLAFSTASLSLLLSSFEREEGAGDSCMISFEMVLVLKYIYCCFYAGADDVRYWGVGTIILLSFYFELGDSSSMIRNLFWLSEADC